MKPALVREVLRCVSYGDEDAPNTGCSRRPPARRLTGVGGCQSFFVKSTRLVVRERVNAADAGRRRAYRGMERKDSTMKRLNLFCSTAIVLLLLDSLEPVMHFQA